MSERESARARVRESESECMCVCVCDIAGWSGAELAGLVRSATSFALQRALDQLEATSSSSSSSSNRAAELQSQVTVCAEDLYRAVAEVEEAR